MKRELEPRPRVDGIYYNNHPDRRLRNITDRKQIVKALKFHISEWNYLSKEVQANFHNNVRNYLTWLVKSYPSLDLRTQ